MINKNYSVASRWLKTLRHVVPPSAQKSLSSARMYRVPECLGARWQREIRITKSRNDRL